MTRASRSAEPELSVTMPLTAPGRSLAENVRRGEHQGCEQKIHATFHPNDLIQVVRMTRRPWRVR